jgi:hypothetical protein
MASILVYLSPGFFPGEELSKKGYFSRLCLGKERRPEQLLEQNYPHNYAFRGFSLCSGRSKHNPTVEQPLCPPDPPLAQTLLGEKLLRSSSTTQQQIALLNIILLRENQG